VTRLLAGLAGSAWRGPLAALVSGALLAAGCSVFRTEPLDVPPGQQVVMGEVVVVGFGVPPHVVLDIAREDGAVRHELPVDLSRSPFLITLPPGRYQVQRLRINESGSSFPEEPWFRVGAEFLVGDTAVYVGTLQLERVVFARNLTVRVQDEFDRLVPELRARYPELPPVIGRSLMRPT